MATPTSREIFDIGLDHLSVTALRELADEWNIPGREGMAKAQLAEALKETLDGAPEAEGGAPGPTAEEADAAFYAHLASDVCLDPDCPIDHSAVTVARHVVEGEDPDTGETFERHPMDKGDDGPLVHRDRIYLVSVFATDAEGHPTGGVSTGQGIDIEWQRGVDGPNGAIIEDVVQAVIDRLEFFQNSAFACMENNLAIQRFRDGLDALEKRTQRRKAAGIKGTYEGP